MGMGLGLGLTQAHGRYFPFKLLVLLILELWKVGIWANRVAGDDIALEQRLLTNFKHCLQLTQTIIWGAVTSFISFGTRFSLFTSLFTSCLRKNNHWLDLNKDHQNFISRFLVYSVGLENILRDGCFMVATYVYWNR